MPFNPMSNPWQINSSDSEDEIIIHSEQRISTCLKSSKPPTPKILRKHDDPRTPDWSPVIDKEGQKKRFGRKKTAPSFEKAPSHHKPIFSGSSSLKSSSLSLFEPNQSAKTIINYCPETPPASPVHSDGTFNPFGMIQENLNRFIHTYIPKDYPSFIHCYIRRDKSGIQKGLFPTYYLHTEHPSDGKKIFLLAARKVAKLNRQAEYLITTNIETLSEKSGGDGCVAKLRANGMNNTHYTLYDNGKNPNKYGYKSTHSKNGLRRELAGIVYETSILGFNGTRTINTVIPKLDHDIQPSQGEETILDRWREMRFTDLCQLRNRSPDYDEETRTHTLQFNNTMTFRRSVKNFQMTMETDNHKEEVVMEFARINNDTFMCDFCYPLSAIQAFGIALSSFDTGVTRE